jgi:DNA-binding CsgD family transcriptional regulator/tetratricopeptide (TPR) repeat protein
VFNSDPGAGLVGRRSECEVLDRLLADVRAHQSRVLVLRGEAGIGKTALMEYLATTSSGCRVVRAAGVESEVELGFAGAHQLCAPVLDRMDDLPDPQRDALGTALGLAAGVPADRFLVGLAVLTLLSAAAEERPLVCLVDDAQWLDQLSGQILAFVGRRLLAEPIALVFAVREPGAPLELTGLPEHKIGGLADGDARALPGSVFPGRLDERVRDRIVAETRGNPLALLELPRGLTAAELAGGFALPAVRPLTDKIEHSFVTRVGSLPEQTQRLLLLAAAEPLGDAVLLQRAAEVLDIGADAKSPAEDEGLIEFGARVQFRHPLVRSAAYRAGSVADRQAVHRALAEVTDPQVQPDRRAWHRAHGAAELDEDIATELERSAGRASSRGGVAAAAAFLEQALKLTVDPGARASRALAAAQAKFEAADYDAADALMAVVEIGPLDDLLQAQLARLRGQVAFARHRGRDAPPLFLEAAKRLESLDDRLARETYLEALGAAVFAGRLSTHPTLAEIAETARAASAQPDHAGPIDLLLDGVARRFTDGYSAAVAPLRSALDVFPRHAHGEDAAGTRWFWLVWLLAAELWDDVLLDELATRAVGLSRAAGALEQLPIALVYRAGVHINAGEFGAAVALIEECNSIAAATGNPPLGYASALLHAWRGDEGKALNHFSWALSDANLRREGRAIGQIGYFSAILHNGLGRCDEALAGARAACEHDDLGVRGFALVELIEAAAHGGSPDVAEEALRELEERAVAAGTDWALGMLARSGALVASGTAADALFLDALERLGRTRVVVHLARAHLVYGEWLRRESRRRDAREQLRAAYDMFHGMGAEAFAARARRELLATGATARPRTVAASNDLTPQETQIARLAVEGRSNPEIASELFISPRTVEYHLSKVYTKLGVGSRRELRRSLPLSEQLNPRLSGLGA